MRRLTIRCLPEIDLPRKEKTALTPGPGERGQENSGAGGMGIVKYCLGRGSAFFVAVK